MVNRLKNLKTTAGKSNPKAKKLITRLKKDFEANMNNDLHVKDAFNALFKNVSKLVSLAEKGKVSIEDIGKVVAELKRIDQALQVIF
jgi:cysteinyl-tRNA synthetase